MGENKDIRGLLQTEFEQFEADPGVDLWPAIEADLNPKKKKIAVWWTYTVAAASIILLFGSLFWLINQEPVINDKEDSQIVKIDTVWKEKPAEVIHQEEKKAFAEEIESRKPEQEENRSVERRVPVPATSYQVSNVKENFADRAVPKVDVVETTKEKPRKKADINVSQIAMQTMGPGLSPITDEIERKAAPEISTDKRNIERGKVKRINTARQFASNNKNSIDLNNLTAENAVSFVSSGLSKLKNSPVEFYQEKGAKGELKVYQLDFLNLKITKKTRKTPLKKM